MLARSTLAEFISSTSFCECCNSVISSPHLHPTSLNPRRNHRYSLAQMVLALIYPLVLGQERLETASFVRANSTFQYLTGLESFPDPQTLRCFLLQAPASFRE